MENSENEINSFMKKDYLDKEFDKMTKIRYNDVSAYMRRLAKKLKKREQARKKELRKKARKENVCSILFGKWKEKPSFWSKLGKKLFFMFNDAEDIAYKQSEKDFETMKSQLYSKDYKPDIILMKKKFIDGSDKVDWYDIYDSDEETMKNEVGIKEIGGVSC